VVDLLEVVEVEDDQRELAVVAQGARHLPGERLVEVAAIVESGQRVEVRHLTRLAEAAGVLERGAGAQGQALQLLDRLLAEGTRGRAREDRQEAELAAFACERHGDAGVDEVAMRGQLLWRVPVRDRDRARLPTVGRPCDRLPLSLFRAEAESRDKR